MPDDTSMSTLAARHDKPQPAALAGLPAPDAAAVERLAALSSTDYDRCRDAEAKALGVRVGTLDKLVAVLRGEAESDTAGQGRAITFEAVEPWPEPVNGADLLDELAALASRHLILPDHGAVVVALWATLTWLADSVRVLPILAVISAVKGCGKSTVLDLLGRWCRRARLTSNITAAALFRFIEKYQPTLLIDEADSFMKDNEALRGVVNSGHTRASAWVVRTVGDNHEPCEFSTWCAKAIAAIGRLQDTITDRSIILSMRRKAPGETVVPLPADDTFYPLRQRLARWSADNADTIRAARPELPVGVINRRADNWRVLIAIADAAGGEWPALARDACRAAAAADTEDDSLRVSLLADIREIFAARRADRLSTSEIIGDLLAMTERPWTECHRGKPITPRQLSRWLRDFGIHSVNIKLPNGTVPKGYRLDRMQDAFARYLPPENPLPRYFGSTARVPAGSDPLPGDGEVADTTAPKASNGAGGSGVADKNPPPAGEGIDGASRILDAATAAGISPDLLRREVTDADLTDPDLDLHQYAAGLAREAAP